jgi:hypothetical protein
MSFQNTVNRLISRLLPGAVTLLAAWLVSGCAAIHSTPYLSYLSVTPDATSIALGQTAQFKVMATYSNGVSDDVSASVTWKTLAPDIASVDASGVASSMAVGKATVVATMSGVSGFAEITVSQAALESLTITAPTSSLDLGQSAQLKASGTYSDKSVQDVTNLVSWSAAQPNVVTVNAAGLAVSKATGSTQITASLNNINASSQITVSPAALVSMAVVSKDAAVPLGVSEQFHAVGTYTDGSTADLTGAASWTSSAPGVVSINATGAAATRTVGSALITAAVAGTSERQPLLIAAWRRGTVDRHRRLYGWQHPGPHGIGNLDQFIERYSFRLQCWSGKDHFSWYCCGVGFFVRHHRQREPDRIDRGPGGNPDFLRQHHGSGRRYVAAQRDWELYRRKHPGPDRCC